MIFDLRQRAVAVRHIPLPAVLAEWGAAPDRRDKAKWHTDQGPLSVSGAKFMNWQRDTGGGGAIDLVMHLGGLDFRAALVWLEQHFPAFCTATGGSAAGESCESRPGNTVHTPHGTTPAQTPGLRPLRLPAPDSSRLADVRRYLVRQRHLPLSHLEPLIDSGSLYADRRGNAVFLLRDPARQAVGAELRGTGTRLWRGMAPGTNRNAGYFGVGRTDAATIVLCESAIDAISCRAFFPDRLCISTSGARSRPVWLSRLIDQGGDIHCGFDADTTGETLATEMNRLFPSIHRLRPPAHDWNDALCSNQ
jgi:hypothetical protein